MTRFWWVRHGPTHRSSFTGWTDVPADLSDTAQIERLNSALPTDAVVISSDLIRCTATADAVSAGRHRLPHDPDLREFNFGEWESKPFSQIADEHPELSRSYWETPGDIAPPNGESWNQGAARVQSAVDRLLASHSGQNIIIVAHFGVILTQVQAALGCSAQAALKFTIDNLSVTELEHMDGPWRVLGINHTP